jgi:DNA-binding transcriptional regulator YdaS (Cro superfamily)
MLLLLDLGSQIDVAQRMGVSPQRVSQLVSRARARIAAKGA